MEKKGRGWRARKKRLSLDSFIRQLAKPALSESLHSYSAQRLTPAAKGMYYRPRTCASCPCDSNIVHMCLYLPWRWKGASPEPMHAFSVRSASGRVHVIQDNEGAKRCESKKKVRRKKCVSRSHKSLNEKEQQRDSAEISSKRLKVYISKPALLCSYGCLMLRVFACDNPTLS